MFSLKNESRRTNVIHIGLRSQSKGYCHSACEKSTIIRAKSNNTSLENSLDHHHNKVMFVIVLLVFF